MNPCSKDHNLTFMWKVSFQKIDTYQPQQRWRDGGFLLLLEKSLSITPLGKKSNHKGEKHPLLVVSALSTFRNRKYALALSHLPSVLL